MKPQTFLLALIVASPAAAAPFDDLKQDYTSCLRHELGATASQRHVPASDEVGPAFARCAAEAERLERADPRRPQDGYGLSPSSWQVIEGVLGTGNRRRLAGILFR